MAVLANSTALADNALIRNLVKLVAELELDINDFVIFGSGPLLAHGLRTEIQDLDIVARGTAWRRVAEEGVPTVGELNGAPMVAFYGDTIQFSRGWVGGEWDVDRLIEQAEIVEGLPFAQLTDVLRYKQALGRPKDRKDVELLIQLLGGRGSPWLSE